MRLQNHKGFTLLECLVSLFVVAAFLVLTISKSTRIKLDHLYFMNEYLSTQCQALIQKERVSLSKDYVKKTISFNQNGRVNMANTIEMNHHTITIHLGSGYICYE